MVWLTAFITSARSTSETMSNEFCWAIRVFALLDEVRITSKPEHVKVFSMWSLQSEATTGAQTQFVDSKRMVKPCDKLIEFLTSMPFQPTAFNCALFKVQRSLSGSALKLYPKELRKVLAGDSSNLFNLFAMKRGQAARRLDIPAPVRYASREKARA